MVEEQGPQDPHDEARASKYLLEPKPLPLGPLHVRDHDGQAQKISGLGPDLDHDPDGGAKDGTTSQKQLENQPGHQIGLMDP